jgi:hypothetical protein
MNHIPLASVRCIAWIWFVYLGRQN